MKICFFFTTDLMFSSRVKPVATESGFDLQFPGLQQSTFEPPPDLVIFDLESVSQSELEAAMSQLKSTESRLPKTVAYAPHVKESKLENARAAGVEVVWTRGQFNKGFASLFQS